VRRASPAMLAVLHARAATGEVRLARSTSELLSQRTICRGLSPRTLRSLPLCCVWDARRVPAGSRWASVAVPCALPTRRSCKRSAVVQFGRVSIIREVVASERCFDRNSSLGASRPGRLARVPSDVRTVSIAVDHTRRRQRLRIRDHVSVRIRDRCAGEETVTCVIPGHDRAGEELVADELVVEDGPLAFSYRGVCGYGTTFDYSG